TPTLARMVAGKKRELVFPVRWFNIGNRFRYERPQ
ncbi:MAG: hisS, partial [Parcubacteria group bacterium]|nr:hisS [Parcubacteria group bacterium]